MNDRSLKRATTELWEGERSEKKVTHDLRPTAHTKDDVFVRNFTVESSKRISPNCNKRGDQDNAQLSSCKRASFQSLQTSPTVFISSRESAWSGERIGEARRTEKGEGVANYFGG